MKNVILAKGWDYTQEYEKAWREGRLLTAQIETSNICNLACSYCFREETGKNVKRRLPGEITTKQTTDTIDKLVKLGAKTINIIGAGEPTLDPSLITILRYIADKNATPVIFTNGTRLNDRLIEEIQKARASVVIKVNSFSEHIQDRLVNKNGYTKKRNKTLKLLEALGFNESASDGSYQTRLGIDSVICQENKDEILDIFRYCRENNIMPLIKTFIPAGRTQNKTNMEITRNEFLEIAKKVREIDAKEYDIHYQRLIPMLGGVPCTQCSKASMYITILGDIFECPGQMFNYGNIRSTTIQEAFEKIKQEQKNTGLTCPPRINYWKLN